MVGKSGKSIIVIKSVIIRPDLTDVKSIVFKYHTPVPKEIIFMFNILQR